MTREEKLKKINAELEKMSDEELDKVNGGSYQEYVQLKDKIVSLGYKVGTVSAITKWLNENLDINANIDIGGLFSDGESNTYRSTKEYDVIKTGPGTYVATFKVFNHQQVLQKIDDWGKSHKK